MNIRKTLRFLHRDFGYFVVGITFIYTVSGIALNHRTDWNPHYSLVSEELQVPVSEKTEFSETEIGSLLSKFEYEPVYKKHFTSNSGAIKIFVESGTVLYHPAAGVAELEILTKRPFFFQINKLHLAQANRVWIWISDLMAVFMLFVAISGLFILKGKNGIKGRGLWLTAAGVLVPLVMIIFFLS